MATPAQQFIPLPEPQAQNFIPLPQPAEAPSAPLFPSNATIGPAQPESLWQTIKKWTMHPLDTIAQETDVSPSESGTFRARAHDIAQSAGQLEDIYSNEGGLLTAPEAAVDLMKVPGALSDAFNAYRAGRAAKLAQDAGEWQKINDVLGVPKTGIRIAPSASSAAEATTMPGRTVAALGYTAKSLDAMEPIERMNLIDSHLQTAGQAIENAAKSATDAGKTVDVSYASGGSQTSIFQRISDPDMRLKMIQQYNDTARSLGITDLTKATPQEALALRQALRAGKTFSGFSDAQTTANISKQLGSAVSSDLKAAVPDFSKLDQAYTDLRGARDSAVGQVKNTLKQAPPLTLAQKAGRFTVQKILPRVAEGTAIGAGGYLGYRALHDVGGPE